MYALIDNGQVAQVGELTTLFPNTSFPAGFNQAAFAADMGALEVIEGERKDERFYWVTFSHYEVQGDKAVRVYTNTAKDLDGLKSAEISKAKAAANSALASTDWMVIRKAERGVEIPADVVATRAHVVAACAAKELSISVSSTVEELIAALAEEQPAAQVDEITIQVGSAGPV